MSAMSADINSLNFLLLSIFYSFRLLISSFLYFLDYL